VVKPDLWDKTGLSHNLGMQPWSVPCVPSNTTEALLLDLQTPPLSPFLSQMDGEMQGRANPLAKMDKMDKMQDQANHCGLAVF
jgi:hypothetical protein